jgi:hypothetical protein
MQAAPVSSLIGEVVARDGIEPPTPAFSGPRSTTELSGLGSWFAEGVDPGCGPLVPLVFLRLRVRLREQLCKYSNAAAPTPMPAPMQPTAQVAEVTTVQTASAMLTSLLGVKLRDTPNGRGTIHA